MYRVGWKSFSTRCLSPLIHHIWVVATLLTLCITLIRGDKEKYDRELDKLKVLKDRNLNDSYIYSLPPHPHCAKPFTCPYDFLLGFSTGHVGTTTLSSSKTYGNPSHVQFSFEGTSGYGYHGHSWPGSFLKTKEWKKMNYTAERDFVKSEFLPFLRLHLVSNSTSGGTSSSSGVPQTPYRTVHLDLGHHTLYFMEALVDYLTTETKYRFLVVRLTRPRYEAARSLIYIDPEHPQDDTCWDNWRYCPYERVNDIILKPKEGAWKASNVFQKALWVIDETEERWRRLVDRFPAIDRVYVHWSNNDPESMYGAAVTIARFLGVEESNIPRTIMTMKPHMPKDNETAETTTELEPRSVALKSKQQDLQFLKWDLQYLKTFHALQPEKNEI